MKRQQRIIIQTTFDRKFALNQLLLDAGSTITDWFNTRVEESTTNYLVENQPFFEEITSLEKIKDPKKVYADLASIDWGFIENDTSYLSHDIHPYPAKFIPQIPSNLIARLSIRGEMIWDPFGGSGTTALEAILLGRQCLSTDANPLGEIIGKAKTVTLTKEQEDILHELWENLLLMSRSEDVINSVICREFAKLSCKVPDIPNIENWFHPIAIRELGYLRFVIENLPSEECKIVARVSFSKTVLKASFQDGETRYARRTKEIKPGFVFKCFANDLKTTLAKIRHLGPLLRFRRAVFKTVDLRQPVVGNSNEGCLLKPNSVDLIITSPPYPNANDYHLYHRFRLFWLDYDPRDLAKVEIGSHLRHQKESTGFESYITEMELCLKNCFEALRPGRFAVFVLGSAIFNGRTYDTPKVLSDVAKKIGFEFLGSIERFIHRTKRSFISPARRAKLEKLLILRKPNKHISISLKKAPYKLWPYEIDLRQKEITSVIGKKPILVTSEDYQIKLDALSTDKLRRLTFTHSFESPGIGVQPTWQAVLENGDAFLTTSGRKDPKYVTHGIHPYKGKFYPQLAKTLFNLGNLSAGQIVLDPFCGSGTVLLEGYLNGLRAYGCDMNPLAVKIARAKTEILSIDSYTCDRLLARFTEKLANGSYDEQGVECFTEKIRHEIESWFPKLVANKLGWLLRTITEMPDRNVQEFLQILVSSIIRQVSQQDPRDLRIRRRVEPIKDAPVFELFKQTLIKQRARLQNFAQRSKGSPYKFIPATVWLGDSRQWKSFESGGLSEEKVDAVITSPPYATALPYIDTDRLSILILFRMTSKDRTPLEENLAGSREIAKASRLNLERKIERGEFESICSPKAQLLIKHIHSLNSKASVGFRRRNLGSLLYRYFTDMSMVMDNCHRLLKSGGQAFFVIGDNWTQAGNTQVRIETTSILQEMGLTFGWKLIDAIPITVTKENLRHSKNSITENTVLWFQKVG